MQQNARTKQAQTAPQTSEEKQQWVIWNGSMGILTIGTLGRIEITENGRNAWLDSPFDVVGPFNLDELETHGRISFEACIVMSRQKWQDDQVELRRAAFEQRQKMYERLAEEYSFFGNDHWQQRPLHKDTEQEHRQALNLPSEGKLTKSQIKAAFRKLAQKAHPDAGGSHEEFIRISEARNVLIESAS